MEEQEITYGNELIAKFMGGEYRTDLPFEWLSKGWINTPANNSQQVAQSHQFRYNSDWNWIMPVREKIESLGFVCLFYSNICFIQDINSFTKKIGVPKFYVENYGTLLNECVFRSIVLFIEWYNIHKPEQP